MTLSYSYANICLVLERATKLYKICASGSAVEHLLAKEGVAGSIPVSRSFFLSEKPSKIKNFRTFLVFRKVNNREYPSLRTKNTIYYDKKSIPSLYTLGMDFLIITVTLYHKQPFITYRYCS